jgi:23S rRNA 5-hydroxycytidine C2501 synthase
MGKNNQNSISLELLAPARDFATGKVAVLAGADAVYIGGPRFGARQAAGNTWDDIEQLVKFAHQYYGKIYVTVNTIFSDAETSSVKETIQKAYDIGVAAVIIQDMGILEMDLPPIPLIASTQCNNYEVEHIKFLEEAGLSRVILARELSLEQIKEIRTKTKMDLEFFVHGALCVSFSGRCYFSQTLSGKSANRGQCMQACRLPFSLEDADGKVLAKDKFLLSLKDFNLSNSLKDLVEAGITSFKIEGRLKDEFYVANVVAKYRQELDRIIEESNGKYQKASSGKVKLSFEPDLERTFNRGFTNYFLNGRKSDIISLDSQKSIGKFMGKVKEIGRDYFILDRPTDLQNGDGICWTTQNGLTGININTVGQAAFAKASVGQSKIYPNRVLPTEIGVEIYRNADPAFEKKVKNGAKRQIAVDFAIKEIVNGFLVEAKDENNNQVAMEFETEKKPAQKPELIEASWRGQFSKLGETIFYAQNFSFHFKKPCFIPLSVLNDWRRQIVNELFKERQKNYPRILMDHQKTNHLYPHKELNYEFNVANSLARSFYQRHGVKSIEPAFELQNDVSGKKVMTTKHCLKYFLDICPKNIGKEGQGHTCPEEQKRRGEPLYLVCAGKKYRLSFDCARCQMEIWNEDVRL